MKRKKTILMVVILNLRNYSVILNTVDKWSLEVGKDYDVTVEYSYNKFKIKNVMK